METSGPIPYGNAAINATVRSGGNSVTRLNHQVDEKAMSCEQLNAILTYMKSRMISFFKQYFHKNEETQTLSAYFKNAPAEAKERLISDVVRKASADQRAVAEKYHELEKASAR